MRPAVPARPYDKGRLEASGVLENQDGMVVGSGLFECAAQEGSCAFGLNFEFFCFEFGIPHLQGCIPTTFREATVKKSNIYLKFALFLTCYM